MNIIWEALKETAHDAVTKEKWLYISGILAFALIQIVGYAYGLLIAALWLGYWYKKGKWTKS